MLDWLFGDKNLIDKAAAAIDASVLTEQERLDYYLKYQEATLPQNRARRLIALVILGVWAVIVLMAALFGAFGYALDWNGGAAAAVYLLELLFKTVMPSVVVIVSFYFYKRIKS